MFRISAEFRSEHSWRYKTISKQNRLSFSYQIKQKLNSVRNLYLFAKKFCINSSKFPETQNSSIKFYSWKVSSTLLALNGKNTQKEKDQKYCFPLQFSMPKKRRRWISYFLSYIYRISSVKIFCSIFEHKKERADLKKAYSKICHRKSFSTKYKLIPPNLPVQYTGRKIYQYVWHKF